MLGYTNLAAAWCAPAETLPMFEPAPTPLSFAKSASPNLAFPRQAKSDGPRNSEIDERTEEVIESKGGLRIQQGRRGASPGGHGEAPPPPYDPSPNGVAANKKSRGTKSRRSRGASDEERRAEWRDRGFQTGGSQSTQNLLPLWRAGDDAVKPALGSLAPSR